MRASRAASPSRAAATSSEPARERADDVAQVQAHGREHLVVARAPEVDAAAGLADALGEAPLERRVTVLVGELDVPGAARMLLGERAERRRQLREVGVREQPLRVEHLRVRERGAHVVGHEALIEGEVLAGRVAQHALIERCALVPQATHEAPCCSAGVRALTSATISVPVPSLVNTSAEDALRCQVGHDVHAPHAAADRVLDGLGLRQHALGDAALLAQALQAAYVRVGDERARVGEVAEDPRGAGAQDQLLGAERRAQRRRHGIGIDVEQRAGLVRRQRAHDRHQAVVEELAQHRGVHRVDVADEAEVDQLALAPHAQRRALVRAHQARVHAADADGVELQVAAQGEDARVDETVEDHRGHVDRLLVRDAPSLDHARRHPERGGQLGQLWAAAVHQHDAHAEVMQDRDLLDQRARSVRVGKHPAAGLHHEGLALVHADVGRRTLQGADRQGLVAAMHDHRLGSPGVSFRP